VPFLNDFILVKVNIIFIASYLLTCSSTNLILLKHLYLGLLAAILGKPCSIFLIVSSTLNEILIFSKGLDILFNQILMILHDQLYYS